MARDDKTNDSDAQHEDLAKQISDLREDIAKLANSMLELAKQNGAEPHRAAEAAEKVKDFIGEQSQPFLDAICADVQRQPLKALGVAAATGALLGLLIRAK